MPLPRLKQGKVRKRRSEAATRQWLEQSLEQVAGAWRDDGDIINLSGWRTIGYKETDHDIIILAALTTEITEPCGCGALPSTFQKWGPASLAYMHDLPLRDKRTRLYYQRQRYRCRICGKTLLQPVPEVDERRMLTIRLAEYIKQDGLSIFRTSAEIADETGYSEQRVRDMVTAQAKKLEKERRIETPHWLSIDEVYIENQARCVISDPVNKLVIHILPTNSQKDLEIWLLQLPDRHRVEVVTMDMWFPYLGAVQRLLPGAQIVVDRYHVHNLLNNAIRAVLEVVRDSMSYSEHRKYMRDPLILLTSRYHLEKKDAKKEKGKDEKQQTRAKSNKNQR